jgi:hypothetical protein
MFDFISKNIVFPKTRLFSHQNKSLLNNSSRTSHRASEKQSKNMAGSRKQQLKQTIQKRGGFKKKKQLEKYRGSRKQQLKQRIRKRGRFKIAALQSEIRSSGHHLWN